MKNVEIGPIRPPSENSSLLIRVTRGCHWNKCYFCGLYKSMQFSMRPIEETIEDIAMQAQIYHEKNFYLSGCNPAHTSSHGCSIYSQNIPFKQLQRQGNRRLSSNRGKSWKRVIVKPVKSFTIDKKSFDLG